MAVPELLRDFGPRCAYSMQHESHCGPLEVDHFDPRLKKEMVQRYDNLFLASRFCNGKKGDTWPTKAEIADECRFLNPCHEMDYGEQIFEIPETGELVGTTAAARWHIRVCGLNGALLIAERRSRSRHYRTLREMPILVKSETDQVLKLAAGMQEMLDLMIPPISPPPSPG